MKVIDLLNKIAKGEEVPKKIKVGNIIWNYNEEKKTYFMSDTEIELFYVEDITKKLNDEIEIIEEVEDKEYEDIEEITLDDWAEITYSSNWGLLTHDFNLNSNTYTDKINALIRNQKKIIEVLNDKDKDN